MLSLEGYRATIEVAPLPLGKLGKARRNHQRTRANARNRLSGIVLPPLVPVRDRLVEAPELRNFFIGIPKDLIEAARIDGASELYIFLRVILPLGLPAIASLGIFQFLWTWNDLLVALTLARSTQPITVAIFSQLRKPEAAPSDSEAVPYRSVLYVRRARGTSPTTKHLSTR